MKRRLREAVRLTRPLAGAAADVVINPKKVILTASFDAVLNEVRQAFVLIEKKLAKRPTVRREDRDTQKPGSENR